METTPHEPTDAERELYFMEESHGLFSDELISIGRPPTSTWGLRPKRAQTQELTDASVGDMPASITEPKG